MARIKQSALYWTALLLMVSLIFTIGLSGCKKPAEQPNSSAGETSSEIASSEQSEESSDATPAESSSGDSGNSSSAGTARPSSNISVNSSSGNTASQTAVSGNSYYVDSVSGNDKNDGKTEKTAIKTLSRLNELQTKFLPGTKVYLKRGGRYPGEYVVSKSGSKGKPIVYDAYGSGAKPNLCGGDNSCRVTLMVQAEYVEFHNLDITNNNDGLKGVYNRAGIEVTEANAKGASSHIYFNNLDVHDIRGKNLPGKVKGGAGIVFQIGGESPCWLDDVRVENCKIYSTGNLGVMMQSAWMHMPDTAIGKSSKYKFHPITNVSIKNNVLYDLAEDAIFISATKGAVIENNTVYNTCNKAANFSAAAVWTHYSVDAVIQKNEIYDTKLISGDGQGMDIDINCTNNKVQYNYSHDNEGGFLLVCSDNGADAGGKDDHYNKGTIVRYNISQNDGKGKSLMNIYAHVKGLKVYNNTFCSTVGYAKGVFGLMLWSAPGFEKVDCYLANNIFYNTVAGDMTGKVGGDPSIAEFTYKNNLFYGGGPIPEKIDSSNLTQKDPKLANPGKAGKGFASAKAAYALQAGSPCKNAGLALADNGGKDFAGKTVSGTPSIGAIQG